MAALTDPRYRVFVLLGITMACILLQVLWRGRLDPRPDATFVLRTHPSGAAVYRYVVQADFPWVFVGNTPTMRLRPSDLPCQLKVELWGYMTWAGCVSDSQVSPRRAGGVNVVEYPQDGALRLKPRVPVLIPLLYAVRDWVWAYLAAACWLAAGVGLVVHQRARRRAEHLRERLEAGELVADTRIGPYRLEDEIGGGGMGRVFRARRVGETRGEVLALKVLRRDGTNPSAWKEALREADVCRRLMHPNIVSLLDWGEEAGHLYAVMEYVPGETLQNRLRRERLSASEAAQVGLQISEGLMYAHARGIVHCDIKPANLMITPTGSVRILDFGIAREESVDSPREEAETREAGAVVGTPSYLAPECIQRRGDWRADYYSLGATLFEALVGHPPFRAVTTRELLHCHLSVSPPRLADLRPELDPDLCALVADLLAKNPAQRARGQTEVRDRFASLVARKGAESIPGVRGE